MNDDNFSELAIIRIKVSAAKCSAHVRQRGRLSYVAAPTLEELLKHLCDLLLSLQAAKGEE